MIWLCLYRKRRSRV